MKDISCKSDHTHLQRQRQAGIAMQMAVGMLDRETLKEAFEISLIETLRISARLWILTE